MPLRYAAMLAALSAIWGGSYLLIKFALEDVSAPVVVCVRCALASLVLLAVLVSTGRVRGAVADVRARPWWALAHGAIAVALPFTLITLGELEVPSGLTAVLLSPASLFVAMLAPLIDVSERIDRAQGLGMGLGLVGVGLVVGVEFVHTPWEFAGALAIVLAAVFYALSSFIVKTRYGALAAIQTSWISVTVATLLTLPAALATAPEQLPSLRTALALFVLGAVGTALAFVIFYSLIAGVGAGRASLVSYLAPGVALFYGAAFYDEPVTAAAVAGLALILGGVALAARRTRVRVG